MQELHHIVPRNQGGSNDKNNLILLSPTSHAIISLLQSEHYGKCCFHQRQSKYLPPEIDRLKKKWSNICAIEANRALNEKLKDPNFSSKFGKLVSNGLKNKLDNDPVYREERRKLAEYFGKVVQQIACEKANSPEAKIKRKETFLRIKHQSGKKNSQYGTIWITDGTKEGSMKIPKDSEIPEGYRRGRVCK